MPMSHDKAIEVITDARLADELASYFDYAERDSAWHTYMGHIYEMHDIDSTSFNQLMKYLHQNKSVYMSIEQEVHKNLKGYLDTQ